jgi:hypothetical protein
MNGTDDLQPDDEADDGESLSASLEDLANSVRERQGKTRRSDDKGRSEDNSFEWVNVPEQEETQTTDSIPFETIDDASDVLVLGPVQGADCDRNCTALLSYAVPDRTNILAVTVTRSANDWLSMWQRYSSGSPASMVVVSLGEETGGAPASTTISTQSGPEQITIETVSDPSDLTRLGITLSRLISDISTEEERTAVCVHSLTALLQYVEPRRLFRFLHIFRGKLSSVDAMAHYHMDPDAHDKQTVGVFRSLFDTVVRITDEGDLEIVSAP